MTKILAVGDPHATPDELQDVGALFRLVEETAPRADVILYLGDLYHSNDVLSTRVLALYQEHFDRLIAMGKQVVAIRGNHDQVSPYDVYPHALLAHPQIDVVDEITTFPWAVVAPYYPDPHEFLRDVDRFYDTIVSTRGLSLVCHQTFEGALYENGFPARDGVPLDAVKYQSIFSGHIHTPATIGKLRYVGAPRWRTRGDANVDRSLTLLSFPGGAGGPLVEIDRISTGQACRRVWAYEDRPEAPFEGVEGCLPSHLLYVDVYGPTAEYVRDREALLKAAHGARTRGFPDRRRRVAVTEAEGVDRSFQRFWSGWVPPGGTPKEVLVPRLQEVVGVRV